MVHLDGWAGSRMEVEPRWDAKILSLVLGEKMTTFCSDSFENAKLSLPHRSLDYGGLRLDAKFASE